MLDAQHLRSFQEIARTGSYSVAARRLGYTQPALSYQMRLLEKAVGTPLTARAGRSIRLTPAGQSLLRHADQILTAIRVAERDLAHVVGSRAGKVRLASFPSAQATLVADAVAAVSGAHPAIEIRALHADPLDATEMVARGDADLALTYRYAIEDLDGVPAAVRSDVTSSTRRSPLTSVALMTDFVQLVLPRQHPLATTPLHTLAPLADERFLIGSELFRGLLERAAGRAGFTPRVMLVADDYWGMLALAERGVGIALLPGIELHSVRQRDLVVVPMPDWPARHIAVETWPDLLRLPSVVPVVEALRTAAETLVVGAPAHTTLAVVTGGGAARDDARRPADGDWARWFDVETATLPRRAADDPARAVLLSDRTGIQQVHTLAAPGGTSRAVTGHPGGVGLAEITPAGDEVWWFADEHGDEHGIWMVQPFDAAADDTTAPVNGAGRPAAVPAHPSLAAGFSAGLALGRRWAAVGRSDGDRSEIYLLARGDRAADAAPHAEPQLVFASEQEASVGALSADEQLLAFSHSDHGDALAPAIRVVRLVDDGSTTPLADLHDGAGSGVWPVAFCPLPGSDELLVIHERDGAARPLVWSPVTGAEQRFEVQLPGEVTASWYPDGSALLLVHQHRARSELYRLDLADGRTTRVPTPRGTITEAAVRADGTIEYRWSSSGHPPRLLTAPDRSATAGDTEVSPHPWQNDVERGDVPPPAVEDLFVGGGDGDIHALVARPAHLAAAPPPQPTVFLVHGGPAAHDADAYSAVRNAWVAAGYTTVQVNYRGSSGYGARWRAANVGRPGHTELDDLIAVRDTLVADGVTDPDRVVLAGVSWGGYLTLLALGHHPHLWSLGVALVPVADPAAVYTDMLGSIRAAYRVRFGGTPDEAPEAYAAASPLAVADRVDVPVLLTGGLRDPRCPIGQIDSYAKLLAELGKPYELHVTERGHGIRVVAERVAEMATILAFAARHMPTGD